MKIRTAALMGAGAIGSYFVYGLADKLKDNFFLIADGKRKERLEKEGMTINGRSYHLPVKTPSEAKGVDLLIYATKYGDLPGALDQIQEIVTENTIVISLLNGIDSEDTIGRRVGEEHLLHSVMYVNVERRNGQFIFDPDLVRGFFYGEKGPDKHSGKVQALMDLFAGTRIKYTVSESIVTEQWTKYCANIAYNLPQAMLDFGFAGYFDSEHTAFLRDRLIEEVVAVANACGISFTPVPHTRDTLQHNAHFSTWQDLHAGRHTEVDMFLGVLIRLGETHGLTLPYSQCIYHSIKALEEKNDGLFNYCPEN